MHNGKLNATNPLYQFMCFVTGQGFCKIRAYPFANVLCLAYVHKRSGCIVVFVNPGFLRQGSGYLLKFFLRHTITLYLRWPSGLCQSICTFFICSIFPGASKILVV